MHSKKNLLIIYPHFYPAWKDGGIIQSLNNTVRLLSGEMNIRVITSAYDREESTMLANIKLHEWNDVFGAKVYYLTKEEQRYEILRKLMTETDCDVMYLNSMFSLFFVVLPLMLRKRVLGKHTKVVLGPRGMLQKGALEIKPVKKKIFLSLLRLSGLCRNIYWHATDQQEAVDIKENFGNKAIVNITKGLPRVSNEVFEKISKKSGELKLIYLSLIAEKKNLHVALEILASLSVSISFDIYGPIKDEDYWAKCKSIINRIPANIKVVYKGGIVPDETEKAFSEHHALFLPTNGENFGHAIYECLNAGRPVLISDKTPWVNLEEKGAGYNIPVENRKSYAEAIIELYKMDGDRYNKMCVQANKIALQYWKDNNFKEMYSALFSN